MLCCLTGVLQWQLSVPSPANCSAPGMLPATGLARAGLKKDIRLATSENGLHMFQRRPRFRLRRELTLKSSCTYQAYVLYLPPVSVIEFCVFVLLSTMPRR